jgi:hypothetical protein
MNTLYPEAKQEDTVDRTFDEAAFITEYQKLDKEGAPEGYYQDRIVLGQPVSRTGEKLSEPHKISIALMKQDKTDAYVPAAKIVAEMKRESKEMAKISPANYSKESDYIADLDKVKNRLDSNKYYNGLKAFHKATSFTDLKTACSQSE